MYFKKFIASSTLAMSIALGSIPPITVNAAVQESNEVLQQYKLAITNRICAIESNLDNKLTNQIGLLFDMRNITEYAMYYLQIVRNQTTLNFSGTEVDYYGKRLIAYVDLFNSKYGSQASTYTNFVFEFGDSNATVESRLEFLNNYIQNNLMETVPNYYEKVLDNLESDLPSDEDEQAVFLRENAQILEQLYKCLLIYQDVPITLSNITPTENGVAGNFTIDGSGSNETIKNKISACVQEHNILLQYGKSYSLRAINQGLDVDTDVTPLEMFTNVTIEEGQIKFPAEIELSLPYKAILASSSVYTPFDSYVGCSEFSNALLSLANNDVQGNKLLKAYNSVKDLRKPLYKRTILSDGSVTGPATILTIDDFINDIESGEPGALVTVQGDFHYNTDVQTWIYSQNELTYDYSIKTKLEETNTTESTTENTTESTTESTTENTISWDIFDQFTVVADTLPQIITRAVDLTNSKTMINTLENVIFVGGSHVVDLKNAFSSNSADLTTMEKQQNIYFVALDSAKYNWLRTATLQINHIISQNPDTKFTIIFDIGSDDLQNVEQYIAFLNECATTTWPAHNIVFKSVGAVNNNYVNASNEEINNSLIQEFNTRVRDNVNQGVQFVDITTAMLSTDGKSLASGYATKSDGYRYTERTALKLCMNTVKACFDVKNGDTTGDTTESTETTEEGATESTTTEENNTKLVADDLSKAVYAYDSITDENYLTQPVLFYGTKYKRARDNMTTAILNNIIKNTTNIGDIKNKDSRYLYINMFGDIVTDDNLVILPGCANPVIYADDYAYNPYTVAFMNSYPELINRGLYFQVASEYDIGKYVLLSENLNESIENSNIKFGYITSNSDVADTNLINCLNINPIFYTNTTDENVILSGQRCIYGTISSWSKSNLFNYNTVVQTFNPVIEEALIFPYNRYDDTNLTIAKAIARNMYEWLAYNRVEYSYSNTRSLNDNYIMHNYIITSSYGTKNPVSYTNDKMLEYKQFIATRTEQLQEQIVKLSDTLINNVSKVSGTLGVDSSFEDPILGKVLNIIRENFIYLIIIAVIILLVAFMKFHKDILETLILLVASVVTMYLFIWVIPIYMPATFNFLLDKSSTSMAYEVLAVKLDEERARDYLTVQLDDEGSYRYNTASLTLYKVGLTELPNFYDNLGISASDVTGGKSHIINQEAGLFVEGDSLKVNIDILFDTLRIYGSYRTCNGSYCYQLNAAKTVSNNIDYYTPYYSITDNLIEKLNTLAQVYNLPKSSATYIGGTDNTNYLLYSYVNSPVFLTPGRYKMVEQEDAETYMENYQDYLDDTIELESYLTAAFGDNYDWLGIAPIFTMLTEENRSTLWAQTMQANGYYDYDWNPDEDKINALITYINDQTRDFIYDMDDYVGDISDETMIKLVSLRALTAFNQKVSQFKNWLYPYSIDYAEIELGDLLNVIYTDNVQKYAMSDWSIATYINEKHSWFILIMFDILVIAMFLLTNIIKYMIPVLYLLLMVILFIRFIVGEDVKVPLRGYLKTSGSLFAMYSLFNISIKVLNGMHGSVWAIVLGLVISLFAIYVTAHTLLAVFMNIFEFGDRELSAKITNLSDKLHLTNLMQNLRFNTVNLVHNKRHNYESYTNRQRASRYDFDSSVDSVYDNRLL